MLYEKGPCYNTGREVYIEFTSSSFFCQRFRSKVTGTGSGKLTRLWILIFDKLLLNKSHVIDFLNAHFKSP